MLKYFIRWHEWEEEAGGSRSHGDIALCQLRFPSQPLRRSLDGCSQAGEEYTQAESVGRGLPERDAMW